MNLHQTLLSQGDSSLICDYSYFLSEGAYNTCIFKDKKKADVEKCVRNINTMFSTNQRRHSLHLLLLLLPQCSVEILKFEGGKWFRMCFSILQSNDLSFKEAACLILSFLVKASEEINDLRQFISKFLRENANATTILKLLRYDKCVVYKYTLLYHFIKTYPGPMQHYTSKVENQIIKLLSRPSEPRRDGEVYCAGRVYSTLKDSQIKKLVSLGHTALDIIFERVAETEDYSDFIDKNHSALITEFDEVDDHVKKVFVASTVVSNVFVYIKAFLENCPAQPMIINPRNLVSLPLRVLQVALKTIQGLKGQEHAYLASLLPSLHQRALSHLRDILESVGENLDIFHGVIQDQITSIIKASISEPRPSQDVSDKNVKLQSDETRICGYEALYSLVQVSKGCYPMPSEVCSSLCMDVIPKKESLQLTEVKGQSLANINLKKTRKKKGYIAAGTSNKGCIIESSSISFTSNDRVVKAALKLTAIWLELGYHCISMQSFMKLNDCLLSLSPLRSLGVYCFADVRVTYYKSLINLALYPHPACPPDYGKINGALVVGSADSDLKVSSLCSGGVGTISFVMSNPQISIFSDNVTLSGKENRTHSEEEIEEQESENENDASDSDVEDMTEANLEDIDDIAEEPEEINEVDTVNEIVEEEKVDEEIENEQDESLNLQLDEEDEPKLATNDNDLREEISLEDAKEANAGENTKDIQECIKLDDSDDECIDIVDGNTSDDICEVKRVTRSGSSGKVAPKRKLMTRNRSPKKKQKEDHQVIVEENEEEVAKLKDMMSSFVDADPDSD